MSYTYLYCWPNSHIVPSISMCLPCFRNLPMDGNAKELIHDRPPSQKPVHKSDTFNYCLPVITFNYNENV